MHHDHVTYYYYDIVVIFSIVVAILASWVGLEIANRISAVQHRGKRMWRLIGSLAMGLGIWSMHFLAMLAFHMNMDVNYNVLIVVVSMLPAIIACWMAFSITGKETMGKTRVGLGALFISIGIAAMHYTGMEAMEMKATISYQPVLFGLSILIAYLTSLAALLLLHRFRKPATRWMARGQKLLSSVIMGVAIAGMHYTGMAAAQFQAAPYAPDLWGPSVGRQLLLIPVSMGAILLLSMVIIVIRMDHRLEQKNKELLLSEDRFRSLFDNAHDAIIIADQEGTILSWNASAEQIFGYTTEEALGQSLTMIMPERFRDAHFQEIKNHVQSGEKKGMGKTLELKGLRKTGEEFPIDLSLSAWEYQGTKYFSGIIRDITERKNLENEVQRLVYRDSLTELANQRLFKERTAMAMEQGQTLGILYIDLDRFKWVNDASSLEYGDQALQAIAGRLKKLVTSRDTLSRPGGDRFLIAMANRSQKELSLLAKSILKLIADPILVGGQEFKVTASIGISLFPIDGSKIDELIQHAESAMYLVKKSGKNHYQFFSSQVHEFVKRKLDLENGLRKAIEREELRLYYQPQVNFASGRIVGVEALIRWEHPELGMISPAEFIPLAEETGLIIPIGEWVLKTACQHWIEWKNQDCLEVSMGINVSPVQFQYSGFLSSVRAIVREFQVDPSQIKIEITESVMQNAEDSIALMHQLKEDGFQLAVDDFGTGYSSLSYLRSMPVDTIKIDQSFIRNMFAHPKDRTLVHGIVEIGNRLGLNMVAEGIETVEHARFLSQIHCPEGQGYWFGRPMPMEDMMELLKGAPNGGQFQMPPLTVPVTARNLSKSSG